MECKQVCHGDGRLRSSDLVGVEVLDTLHHTAKEFAAREVAMSETVCAVGDCRDEPGNGGHLVGASEGGDCAAEVLLCEWLGGIDSQLPTDGDQR